MEFFCSIIFFKTYCVSAGISALISISDGLGPYIFHGKKVKTRLIREEMDQKVLISGQKWHYLFVDNIIQVLFPTFYFDLACKQLCFPPNKYYRQEK